MDVKQRARELLAKEYQLLTLLNLARSSRAGGLDDHPAMRAIIAALTPPEGHVVVTRNEAGQAVAVTRQDDEGRILSVIAEFQPPEGCTLLGIPVVFDDSVAQGTFELRKQKPKLIGWRMSDYTYETADRAVARNWASRVSVQPIFEGDPNTGLADCPEVKP